MSWGWPFRWAVCAGSTVLHCTDSLNCLSNFSGEVVVLLEGDYFSL